MKDAPSRRATTAEQRRESRPTVGFRASVPGFWDQVEREIEALDSYDLIEFLGAGALPIEPRAGFEHALEARLAAAFRRRFLH